MSGQRRLRLQRCNGSLLQELWRLWYWSGDDGGGACDDGGADEVSLQGKVYCRWRGNGSWYTHHRPTTATNAPSLLPCACTGEYITPMNTSQLFRLSTITNIYPIDINIYYDICIYFFFS